MMDGLAHIRAQKNPFSRRNERTTGPDMIIVLDFGSQYSHLIVRRLRDLSVYSELYPYNQSVKELKIVPRGVILSGSPYSVYSEEAPHVDPEIFELGVPVLGICYGMQEIAWWNGRGVVGAEKREYGHAILRVLDKPGNLLFEGIEGSQEVWMSHGDALSCLPEGFFSIAETESSAYAAIGHKKKDIFGLQFHPEVTHTKCGIDILRNFSVKICKCSENWTIGSFLEKKIEEIKRCVGDEDHVIGAVSGGLDSSVAAKIMKEAIGDRFHGIFVDNGLMRLNECSQIVETLNKHLGINISVVDASEQFLSNLKGVKDPEDKRKIIGNTFIYVFKDETKKINSRIENKIKFLVQGTLYPDLIESVSFKGPSQVIKTHHNVGGLLKDMPFDLIEPLRELFKDEVRELGKLLGLPDDLIWRHPFPGPGLSIRILGEITREQLEILRHADFIFIEEIKKAEIYRKISQAFVALLPVKTVGVMGDKRTYEQVAVLRAVTTSDFMTVDIYDFDIKFLKYVSARIINEVKGINRVVYDTSTKPPATIEWE
ncbi:GMP synthase (glutamine-hydrolyzing) domain-containing protein [Pneumocystis carinii B80]|uniref:GMP synthase [glutamine-hydrolyzing] n=1 Tax=Pneumocystis carinii (strain B80) TaxID=1408658 RepID=A0A0W4ZKB1_PNEC8|nr:GMP synthase (glutamine-hydrolyzing) domain-containing protein [Pneumocystis carinii B80]KTW28817.1 GMP synthase (glutamine-hydrolyzing) domain-containing protein [Pneumocystis carinii B80]